MSNRVTISRRDFFPLAILFYWLANNSWTFVILVAVAGTIGGLVGLLSLFVSRGSWRVRLLAPLAGILAGETALFLLLAPGPVWRTIFAIGVLLAAAIVFRLDAD